MVLRVPGSPNIHSHCHFFHGEQGPDLNSLSLCRGVGLISNRAKIKYLLWPIFILWYKKKINWGDFSAHTQQSNNVDPGFPKFLISIDTEYVCVQRSSVHNLLKEKLRFLWKILWATFHYWSFFFCLTPFCFWGGFVTWNIPSFHYNYMLLLHERPNIYTARDFYYWETSTFLSSYVLHLR